jgi:hypothetical protein
MEIPFEFGQVQEGAAETFSGFGGFGSSMSHGTVTSLELCKAMEIMGSGKSVAVQYVIATCFDSRVIMMPSF